MSDITVISSQADAPAPKTSAANHTAWLEQLESAQWQQRLRYQPGHAQQQEAGAAGTDQRALRQPGGRGGMADASQAAQAQRRAGPALQGGRRDGGPGARLVADAAAAAEPRPAIGVALPALRQVAQGAGARAGAAWPQFGRLPAVNWQAHNAHILAGNDGLRVWLRDARYSKAADGGRLLLELRAHLARLGWRLAEFTLNGEQVAGSNESGQSN